MNYNNSSDSSTYMTTGKTIALTRWTFVGQVMSLLLNMLSRLIITFLPRRPGFDPWVGKSFGEGNGQPPTPVFLPREFRGQRILAGYIPWGCKESDTTEQLSTQTQETDIGLKATILQYKFLKRLEWGL